MSCTLQLHDAAGAISLTAKTYNKSNLADLIAGASSDHSNLAARIKPISHSVTCNSKRAKLHAHYLPFRDGTYTANEFVDVIQYKMTSFCLHRQHIKRTQKSWQNMTPDQMQESAQRLHTEALELFKKANRKTNRNGEFGELITYILIESVLNAPQLVAKMSLKTNSQMPIHGSDGIHLKYDATTDRLTLYWGESKCYKSVSAAIKEALGSVSENLAHDKMQHELFLIDQYFDLSDLPAEAREPILSFIDPYSDKYNDRSDASVVFITFDYAGFKTVKSEAPEVVEAAFRKKVSTSLIDYAVTIDAEIERLELGQHTIEIFFLPVPSVDSMRTYFQEKIGWTK